jgi:hypothetical protein
MSTTSFGPTRGGAKKTRIWGGMLKRKRYAAGLLTAFLTVWGLAVATEPAVPLYCIAAVLLLVGTVFWIGTWWASQFLADKRPVPRVSTLVNSRQEPVVFHPEPSKTFYIWAISVTVGSILVSALTGFGLWRSFQDKEEQNAGFLQKERTVMRLDSTPFLRAGSPVAADVWFVNRGMKPVQDARVWAFLVFQPGGDQEDEILSRSFEKTAVRDIGKYPGDAVVGIGQPLWNTGWTQGAVQASDIAGMISGKTRLYILAYAEWHSKYIGERHVATCEWISNLPSKTEPVVGMPLHVCKK